MIPNEDELDIVCKHCGHTWGYHHGGSPTKGAPYNACPHGDVRMDWNTEGITFEPVEDD